MKLWLIKGERSSVLTIFLIEHTYNFYEFTKSITLQKCHVKMNTEGPKSIVQTKIKTVLKSPRCLVSILKTLRALN